MSACDPLIQAERRFKARCLNRSRWDLFPCRGPVVPCRTLSLVSATCNGTVKPWFARPAAVGRHPSQKSPGVYQRMESGVCAPCITRTMSPTSKAILLKSNVSVRSGLPYMERDPRGLSSPRSQRKGLAPSDSLSSWAFSLFWSSSILSAWVLALSLTTNGTFVLVRNWARFDGDAVASVPSGW